MNLLEYFKNKKKCHHDKVTPDKDICYCPDCGELIENRWYITRCSCCGVKLKAIVKDGKIMPEEKFCHNCGEKSFLVEQISKINFIDINYAVLVKTIIEPDVQELTQSWLEYQTSDQPKLITQT